MSGIPVSRARLSAAAVFVTLPTLATAAVAAPPLRMVPPQAVVRSSASPLTVVPAPPIVREGFTVRGRASTRFIRPVQLKIRTATGWKVLRRARTTTKGTYRFTGVRTAKTATYVAFFPRTRHNGRRFSTATSPQRTVKPVTQNTSATMTPPIVQRGNLPADPKRATSMISASFRPIREGRPVVLERLQAGRWVIVRKSKENGAGRVLLSAPASYLGAPAVYRVRALTYHGAATAPTSKVSAAGWDVTFQDTFGGTSLNLNRWNYRDLGQYGGDRLCSTSSKAAVQVGRTGRPGSAAGTASLWVLPDPDHRQSTVRCPYGKFLNANIGTLDSGLLFQHGVFAARIRFQQSQAKHGSFWLQTPEPGSSPKPAVSGVEVDVAEYFGDGKVPGGGLASFVHWWAPDGSSVQVPTTKDARNAQMRKATNVFNAPATFWRQYHVYSVQWTPTGYVFRVDGRETFRTKKLVSRRSEFLVLSMLNADWELRQFDGPRKLPSGMNVDWVRVYQQP